MLTFELWRGSTLIGQMTDVEYDQPFVNCKFAPTSAFADLRPLFDTLDEDLESWEVVYDQIEALNLHILASDGQRIDEFLLHISGEDAWFRY